MHKIRSAGNSKEAYDLGKWCGDPDWRERSPSSEAEIRSYFQSFFVSGDNQDMPECVEPVTAAVWAFVQAHPGCRLVNEHDHIWREDVIDLDPHVWDGNVYRQLGSRYDVQRKGEKR